MFRWSSHNLYAIYKYIKIALNKTVFFLWKQRSRIYFSYKKWRDINSIALLAGNWPLFIAFCISLLLRYNKCIIWCKDLKCSPQTRQRTFPSSQKVLYCPSLVNPYPSLTKKKYFLTSIIDYLHGIKDTNSLYSENIRFSEIYPCGWGYQQFIPFYFLVVYYNVNIL